MYWAAMAWATARLICDLTLAEESLVAIKYVSRNIARPEVMLYSDKKGKKFF